MKNKNHSIIRTYLRRIGARGGKKGGPARNDKLSPERRSEIARAAARARWSKRKPSP